MIGRRLVPLLVAAGHHVIGTTRSPAKAAAIAAQGAAPVLVDVFDAVALLHVVQAAKPQLVMHQLTDLPSAPGTPDYEAGLERNARMRIDGTRNLVAAAKAAGVTRLIAQSIAFMYAPGREPHAETDALMSGEPPEAVSARGVHALEGAVTGTPGIDGIVLRYGRLYGPGTWTEVAKGPAPLHVDAAAQAALLALMRGPPGIYNIAEDDGAVSIAKARAQLGFDPGFRMPAS